MSNSAKAKERRSKRSRTTKHQRAIIASTPTRIYSIDKKTKKAVVTIIPEEIAPVKQLSALEQRMAEMRGRL